MGVGSTDLYGLVPARYHTRNHRLVDLGLARINGSEAVASPVGGHGGEHAGDGQQVVEGPGLHELEHLAEMHHVAHLVDPHHACERGGGGRTGGREVGGGGVESTRYVVSVVYFITNTPFVSRLLSPLFPHTQYLNILNFTKNELRTTFNTHVRRPRSRTGTGSTFGR